MRECGRTADDPRLGGLHYNGVEPVSGRVPQLPSQSTRHSRSAVAGPGVPEQRRPDDAVLLGGVWRTAGVVAGRKEKPAYVADSHPGAAAVRRAAISTVPGLAAPAA